MQMNEKCCRGNGRMSDNKCDASCLWRPLQRATVGNGTKIWGVNLRLDTFKCLISLLPQYTLQSGSCKYTFYCHLSIFTPTVYEGKWGLTLA